MEAAKHYPAKARVTLRAENPGIKLSGLLRNTKNFLIGSSAAKDVVTRLCPDQEVEFLAFTLINHKGRVHSSDYWFINPIGGLDCLAEDDQRAVLADTARRVYGLPESDRVRR